MNNFIQDIKVPLTITPPIVSKLVTSALSGHFCGLSWFKLGAGEVPGHFQNINEVLLSKLPNPQMLR